MIAREIPVDTSHEIMWTKETDSNFNEDQVGVLEVFYVQLANYRGTTLLSPS